MTNVVLPVPPSPTEDHGTSYARREYEERKGRKKYEKVATEER